MSDLVLTHHAVERYIARHARHLTYEEAHAELTAHLDKAMQMKERTIKGTDQWRLDELGVTLVVRRDWRTKEPIVVTILPAGIQPHLMSEEERDEVIAAAARIELGKLRAAAQEAVAPPKLVPVPAKPHTHPRMTQPEMAQLKAHKAANITNDSLLKAHRHAVEVEMTRRHALERDENGVVMVRITELLVGYLVGRSRMGDGEALRVLAYAKSLDPKGHLLSIFERHAAEKEAADG